MKVEIPIQELQSAYLADRGAVRRLATKYGVHIQTVYNRMTEAGISRKPNLEVMRSRFVRYYIEDSNTGCWLWTGCLGTRGYGRTRMYGRSIDSHRAAYIIFVGPIPTGQVVCHRCDVPRCVNPNHLFLGTHADNNADMRQKGRDRQLRGSESPNTKLTAEEVMQIRLSSDGPSVVAKRFGISPSHVCSIRAFIRWSHLEGAQSSE